MTAFRDMLTEGYSLQDPALMPGAALVGTVVHQQSKLRLPLPLAGRDGLIPESARAARSRRRRW